MASKVVVALACILSLLALAASTQACPYRVRSRELKDVPHPHHDDDIWTSPSPTLIDDDSTPLPTSATLSNDGDDQTLEDQTTDAPTSAVVVPNKEMFSTEDDTTPSPSSAAISPKKVSGLQEETRSSPTTFDFIPTYRYVSKDSLLEDPACLAAAYNDHRATCVVGAIQIAAEQIGQLIAQTDGLAAKFVRLSFHDCVGGCDGCVDMSNPSNFGLQTPIDALAPVVEEHSAFLTTGDVWILAGLVACRTSQQETSFTFPMHFVNRPQCAGGDTTGGPHRELPSAHFSTREVLDFFSETFGFSPQEAVAILGAHTLGKAASKNSGFGGDGGWDANPDVLNNGYYNELIDISQFGLDFEENTAFPPFPNQFYWEEEVPEGAPDGTFMLHADMALAFDMEGFLDSETGNVACTLVQTEGRPVCPVSPLLPQAVEYANDNDQWVADFKAAYLKMVSTGCGDGACDPV